MIKIKPKNKLNKKTNKQKTSRCGGKNSCTIYWMHFMLLYESFISLQEFIFDQMRFSKVLYILYVTELRYELYSYACVFKTMPTYNE